MGTSEPLILAADKTGKALYGTRLDWQKLRNADLRTAAKEDVAYVRKQLTMGISARNVLSSMDKLDKRVHLNLVSSEPGAGHLAQQRAEDFVSEIERALRRN